MYANKQRKFAKLNGASGHLIKPAEEKKGQDRQFINSGVVHNGWFYQDSGVFCKIKMSEESDGLEARRPSQARRLTSEKTLTVRMPHLLCASQLIAGEHPLV